MNLYGLIVMLSPGAGALARTSRQTGFTGIARQTAKDDETDNQD